MGCIERSRSSCVIHSRFFIDHGYRNDPPTPFEYSDGKPDDNDSGKQWRNESWAEVTIGEEGHPQAVSLQSIAHVLVSDRRLRASSLMQSRPLEV